VVSGSALQQNISKRQRREVNYHCMKNTIRKEALGRRDAIPPEVKRIKDSLIKERLFSLPEFGSARTVLCYASFRSEVETSGIIRESLVSGKKIVLPKVDREKRRLELYEVRDVTELSPGYMGILEPSLTDERSTSLKHIDLVIMPGAGFDISGNRLGYGGGYYDILLARGGKETPKIALAYEEQIIDSIPSEQHDVKMDIIVTDKRIIRLNHES
jgi:5-formyltetrahydrofolate cyclo-ligase